MKSLFLRNLLFTLLQPGMVAGIIPYFILGNRAKNVFGQSFQYYQVAGALLFLLGFLVMITCIISFAVNGKGTLSPVDPTKKLVTTGLYRFSRNPMYVGVMLILAGEALFFLSPDLLIYACMVFAAFFLFILLHEEPRLEKDFGAEYANYCKRVKRWF